MPRIELVVDGKHIGIARRIGPYSYRFEGNGRVFVIIDITGRKGGKKSVAKKRKAKMS